MILDYLRGAPDALLVIVTAAVWLLASWKVLDALTPFDDDAALRGGDLPYAIERGALALAQAIGLMTASRVYDADERWSSYLAFNAGALWITVAMIVARPVLDRALLPQFNDQQAVRKGNWAVAMLHGGAYLGLGCMAGASMIGSAGGRWHTVFATIAFYVLGLIFVTIVMTLHEVLTPYNLRGRIKEGQVSAGIEAGSLLLATSIVTAVGVAGDVDQWLSSVLAFVLTAALSCLVLLPLWYALLRLGPGHRLGGTHEAASPAAAVTAGALLIAAAGVVAMVVAGS
ncbi:hypothetical protein GCM10027418_30110 [Mariniluteicoccus endophyticus]